MIHNQTQRTVIEHYLDAYNRFDIDGMLAVLHPAIEFKNVSDGQINAQASGIAAFRELAEAAKHLFTTRQQTIMTFDEHESLASIDVDYVGVLAVDLPNGMMAGETLRLIGRSEFLFYDGQIIQITDYS
jgi:ketosteroid isomerase-like protein